MQNFLLLETVERFYAGYLEFPNGECSCLVERERSHPGDFFKVQSTLYEDSAPHSPREADQDGDWSCNYEGAGACDDADDQSSVDPRGEGLTKRQSRNQSHKSG